jgi:hypothetical protein
VVRVRVDPRVFVGHEYRRCTAPFGKTRMRKSNTMKVIVNTILSSDVGMGQMMMDASLPLGRAGYVLP